MKKKKRRIKVRECPHKRNVTIGKSKTRLRDKCYNPDIRKYSIDCIKEENCNTFKKRFELIK